jgi:hypothetical protein
LPASSFFIFTEYFVTLPGLRPADAASPKMICVDIPEPSVEENSKKFELEKPTSP